MMKNKKLAALLGLLLAGSMTVSMAACGSTNSASDTKADSSSQSSDSSSSDSSSDSPAARSPKRHSAPQPPSSSSSSQPPSEAADALIQQILDGGVPVAIQQVEAHVDLRSLRTRNGQTLLMAAARSGRDELLHWLLQTGQFDINAGNAVVPRGFFDLAAHDGAALRDLQQPPLRRADPRRRRRRSHRARQCSGFDSPSLQAEISPFLLAASKGSIEICQLCMERLPAAELHAVDKVPKYPRFYA